MREESINIDRARLNVARSANNGPPVLMWHGLVRSWRDFSTLLPALVCLGQLSASKVTAATLNENLVAAVAKGRTSEVQSLLAQGADPNATDAERTPVLSVAAYGGHKAAPHHAVWRERISGLVLLALGVAAALA